VIGRPLDSADRASRRASSLYPYMRNAARDGPPTEKESSTRSALYPSRREPVTITCRTRVCITTPHGRFMTSRDDGCVTWTDDLERRGNSAAQYLWEREALREVLDSRFEGYARGEIAQRLGCAKRAVEYKLDIIREAWIEGDS
jgi:hypothetical protein